MMNWTWYYQVMDTSLPYHLRLTVNRECANSFKKMGIVHLPYPGRKLWTKCCAYSADVHMHMYNLATSIQVQISCLSVISHCLEEDTSQVKSSQAKLYLIQNGNYKHECSKQGKYKYNRQLHLKLNITPFIIGIVMPNCLRNEARKIPARLGLFASEVLCKVESGHCTFLSDGSHFFHDNRIVHLNSTGLRTCHKIGPFCTPTVK